MTQLRLSHVLSAAILLAAGVAARTGDASQDAPKSVIRDGFETSRPVWNQEQTDATIGLIAHDRSQRAAHEGKTSEHIQFTAGLGSGFYFSYALPKVVIQDDLRVSLLVRSNRPGVQIFARVVLPADIDPETKEPSFLLIPGTIYENVDRWQRIELVEMKPTMERQARVLRSATRRPVSLDGAYIERLVVNLFSGSGMTDIFLDELSVGPVPESVAAAYAAKLESVPAVAGAAESTAPSGTVPRGELGRIKFDRGRLKKRADDGLYHDAFFTAIYAPGADLASLRYANFDVLIEDIDADPKRFEDAVSKDFLLMPRMSKPGNPLDADRVAAKAMAFPSKNAVMAWDLGDRLGLAATPQERAENVERIRASISRLRALPGGVSKLTSGTIDDELSLFARAPKNIDLLGIRPSSWGSSNTTMDTFKFLRQRRDLTARNNSGAFYWADLPATPPQAVPLGIWGHDVPPAWGVPQVQPEQIRLMTYAALSAGYRGLAFRGDADLTRPAGRMLLLEMALLNAEIDLCESIFAGGSDPISIDRGFDPDPSTMPIPGSSRYSKITKFPEIGPIAGIQAAGIGTRDKKGKLLVVTDLSGASLNQPGRSTGNSYKWLTEQELLRNSQFQPGQLARNDLKITCIVPEGAVPFEISPGRVRALERERYPGGTRITIPEFDTTALILVTNDIDMAERVRAVVESIRPRAVQMAIEQAELKLKWVSEINGRLAAEGHYLIQEKDRKAREINGGGSISTDQADLLSKAEKNIKTARENLEREDYENAWLEARRASRPLRILMAGHWKNAYDAMVRANSLDQDIANDEFIKVGRAQRIGPPLIVPGVASAPLASFNTLPQHFLWVDWMKSARFGPNLIPSGSFDQPDTLAAAGWVNEAYQYDGIKSLVKTKPNGEKGKRGLVQMIVEPVDPAMTANLPPFLDYPAAAIRSPAVKVKAGEFFRITVFVKRSIESSPGVGGVVVRDSIGGEALQFTSRDAIPALTKVVLYRRASADGELSVTLGLAGYGEAFFDEVTIQRVESEPTRDASPSPAPAPVTEASGVARLPRPERPEVAPRPRR